MKLSNKNRTLMQLGCILTLCACVFISPAPANAVSEGFWQTNGNRIVDSGNKTVRIMGVNWFGLETGNFAPHGLWTRGYKEMLDQIKNLGFNTIRLPFSNQALDNGAKTSGIDSQKNPDLVNLSPLEVMDKVINYAGSIGLKVILDQHRPDSNGQSALWYSSSLTESKWISDWTMLATRYANNQTVVGADLHNEPHDNACWGCKDQSTDWKMAAQKAGNAILKVNPNLLIIVEGVQAADNQWYWWGGNLASAITNPIKLDVPNRVVYSPHDYPSSISSQPWFSESNYPDNLPALWDRMWGNLVKNNIAPVLLGEFGTKLEITSDKQWLETLTKYINDNGINWSFWSLNPNSGDTGGILKDDWTSVNQEKMEYLKAIMNVNQASINPMVAATPSTNVEDNTPATPEPSVSTPVAANTSVTGNNIVVKYNIRQQWNSGYVADVDVQNTSDKPVNGWSIILKFDNTPVIKQAWNANVGQSDRLVKAGNADWNGNIPAKSTVTWGFEGVKNGNQIPAAITEVIVANDIRVQTPTPEPTPVILKSSTQTPTEDTVSVNILTPNDGVSLSGVQPFKAIMNGILLNNYQLYWQVDDGQLNLMTDNQNGTPHKEAIVDFSGWNWRGSGPYKITFIAKNNQGGTLSQKSVNITISN